MKKHSHHFPHSLALVGLLMITFAGVAVFSYDSSLQAAIVIASGAAYLVWGIVHHISHHDLTMSIVFEYFCVSALGVMLLLFLLYRQ